MKICVLPGDGIGVEITAQAVRVLEALGLGFEIEQALLGGCAVDATGDPYPEATQKLAQAADAVLLGAVGGPKWDGLPREQRPERGLLGIRKQLGLFANLRPAVLYPELANASTLKPEVVSGLDILIVRELTGDIYFGQPRGIELRSIDGVQQRYGYNTMHYNEGEIRRIGRVAFEAACKRGKRLCSVDKMNVLETTQLWRDVMNELAPEYPEVALTHMLVDNCAMQLVRAPKQFDVIVTGNMFGDILSDEASMLTGSIGMLPSASLDENGKGLYEPSHGSARIGFAWETRNARFIRTYSRLGARYCGQKPRQSTGDNSVGGDDAALYLRSGRGCTTCRNGSQKGVGARLSYKRYL